MSAPQDIQHELKGVLLDLIDAVNFHQQLLGHLILGEREQAIPMLTAAGDVIHSAVDRVGRMIEAKA